MPADTSRPGRAALALLVLCGLAGCGGTAPVPPPATGAGEPAGGEPGRFVDVSREAGLVDLDEAWPDGTFFIGEIMGPGVGLLDHDRDGDLDILQVRMPRPGAPAAPSHTRLLEQQADGTFRDVTPRSGLGGPGFGQGVAIGDVDDDGDDDVYFANFGRDALYLASADGTYRRAPETADFPPDGWSSSAAFCDYDADGDLDLYVARYLEVDFRGPCPNRAGAPDYCGPGTFDGLADRLYRNDGGARFTDVTRAAGIVLPEPARAKGLGVVCLDLTGDDRADIYVANDGEPNQLWVNRGDGTFRDEAVIRGVAVNRHGRPEASMGIAVGDVDGDGRLDLLSTHLTLETHTLYMATAGPIFVDRTAEAGLAERDVRFTGFGCAFLDHDLDGDLDLAVVNGAVSDDPDRPSAPGDSFWTRYADPNVLLENLGDGRFENAARTGGAFAASVAVHRGLAVGDVDRDGDPDLLVSRHDNSLRLYRNDVPAGRHWLSVRALTGARDALGARITLLLPEGRRRVAPLIAAHGYQSSSPARAHFGLGASPAVEGLEVAWPDGSRERFDVPAVDREIAVREGQGLRLPR